MRGRRDLFSGIKRVGWFKTRERKFFTCQFPKISISLRHPASFFGGAYRDRHDTRGGEAVDADVPVDERRGCGRRNRVVLAPQRLTLMPTMRKRIAADGGNRQGSPRRSRISRKPSRREGRCDHRLYLWTRACAVFFCARAPGAAATRPSLRPAVGDQFHERVAKRIGGTVKCAECAVSGLAMLRRL